MEIEKIQQETGLEMKEIIFDTNCCDWGNNTLIKEYVMYKDNLLFLIEIDDNLKIGGFIYDRIREINVSKIRNSFLFTFKNGNLETFEISSEKTEGFELMNETENILFKFGYCD